VNRLGDSFIRPHDIEFRLQEDGSSVEAAVDHLVYLGFEVRVELSLKDGQHLWAQVTREEASHLGLERGKTVHVHIHHSRAFGKSVEDPLPKP
jgi:sulfate/thiosulfate transport system ATP-binding protein